MILYIIIPLLLLLYHLKYKKMFSIRSRKNDKDFAFFYVRGIISQRSKIVQTLNPSEPSVLYFDDLEQAHLYYMTLFFNYHYNVKKEVD